MRVLILIAATLALAFAGWVFLLRFSDLRGCEQLVAEVPASDGAYVARILLDHGCGGALSRYVTVVELKKTWVGPFGARRAVLHYDGNWAEARWTGARTVEVRYAVGPGDRVRRMESKWQNVTIIYRQVGEE